MHQPVVSEHLWGVSSWEIILFRASREGDGDVVLNSQKHRFCCCGCSVSRVPSQINTPGTPGSAASTSQPEFHLTSLPACCQGTLLLSPIREGKLRFCACPKPPPAVSPGTLWPCHHGSAVSDIPRAAAPGLAMDIEEMTSPPRPAGKGGGDTHTHTHRAKFGRQNSEERCLSRPDVLFSPFTRPLSELPNLSLSLPAPGTPQDAASCRQRRSNFGKVLEVFFFSPRNGSAPIPSPSRPCRAREGEGNLG